MSGLLTNFFARFWYCQDLRNCSILKIAIKKAIHKSPHDVQKKHLFPDEDDPHKRQKWNYKIKLLQFVQVILSTVQFNRTQKRLFDLVIQFIILRVELISTTYNNY